MTCCNFLVSMATKMVPVHQNYNIKIKFIRRKSPINFYLCKRPYLARGATEQSLGSERSSKKTMILIYNKHKTTIILNIFFIIIIFLMFSWCFFFLLLLFFFVFFFYFTLGMNISQSKVQLHDVIWSQCQINIS